MAHIRGSRTSVHAGRPTAEKTGGTAHGLSRQGEGGGGSTIRQMSAWKETLAIKGSMFTVPVVDGHTVEGGRRALWRLSQ